MFGNACLCTLFAYYYYLSTKPFDLEIQDIIDRFGIDSNFIYLYKEGHHTIRNKGDLDSFIKLRLQSLLYKAI